MMPSAAGTTVTIRVRDVPACISERHGQDRGSPQCHLVQDGSQVPVGEVVIVVVRLVLHGE